MALLSRSPSLPHAIDSDAELVCVCLASAQMFMLILYALWPLSFQSSQLKFDQHFNKSAQDVPPQSIVLRSVRASRQPARQVHLLEHASENFVELEEDLGTHLDHLLRLGQLFVLTDLELRNIDDKGQT